MFLSRRRASGVVSGIPDMILTHRGRTYGFELKTETGVVSAEQQKVHSVWMEDGTPVYVIRSFEEFLPIIEQIVGQKEIKLAS